MKDEEVNRIIAEFVGTADRIPINLHEMNEQQLRVYSPYSRSLDALVPVWDKLKGKGVWLNAIGNINYNQFALFADKPTEYYSAFDPYYFYESLGNSTIQQAAAHATAKAIKELK